MVPVNYSHAKIFIFYNNLNILHKIKKVVILITHPALINNLQLMKVLSF